MVHGCMVYTGLAPRRQQFHASQRCKYTTSVDIQSKTRYKKLFTHVESYASAVSLLESLSLIHISEPTRRA